MVPKPNELLLFQLLEERAQREYTPTHDLKALIHGTKLSFRKGVFQLTQTPLGPVALLAGAWFPTFSTNCTFTKIQRITTKVQKHLAIFELHAHVCKYVKHRNRRQTNRNSCWFEGCERINLNEKKKTNERHHRRYDQRVMNEWVCLPFYPLSLVFIISWRIFLSSWKCYE